MTVYKIVGLVGVLVAIVAAFMTVPYADPIIAIAPTVGKHDYDGFRAISAPLLVVCSENDFATDRQALDTWFAGLPMTRQLVRERCDNHFFRGHEKWLVETICRFLESNSRV